MCSALPQLPELGQAQCASSCPLLTVVGEVKAARRPLPVKEVALHDAGRPLLRRQQRQRHGQGLGPARVCGGCRWVGRAHPRRIRAAIAKTGSVPHPVRFQWELQPSPCRCPPAALPRRRWRSVPPRVQAPAPPPLLLPSAWHGSRTAAATLLIAAASPCWQWRHVDHRTGEGRKKSSNWCRGTPPLACSHSCRPSFNAPK